MHHTSSVPLSHNDALGQPVVIGATYGYTISSSGITDVVTGKAEKFTEKGVTLRIISRTKYVYGNLSDMPSRSDKPTVSVYSCNLFPIPS